MMKKTFKTADQLAKEALASKPIYTHDEPSVFGNPDTLTKTNEDIEREENRATEHAKKANCPTIGSDKHK